MKHVLNHHQNLSENDRIIVEDILTESLVKLKNLDTKNLPKIHYQINVSYEF
tara:strand:- start:1 stop:156 length:156 start_codon:yes stop_codon:yes gene_type:complete